MSLRIRIFIISGIVILIATAVILFVLQRSKNRNPDQAASPTSTDSGMTVIDSSNFNSTQLNTASPVTVVTTTPVVVNPLEATKISVRQFARVFVERYGTYSSDNSLQNIRDVEPMITKSFSTYLKSIAPAPVKNQPFVGATTKVVTAELTEWSDTAATVRVQATKREERSTGITTSQPSGTVKLIKQGTDWLVDGLYWDK